MTRCYFQDQIGGSNHCHGCGPDNANGLKIKSFWQGDRAICRFHPKPDHCAGVLTVVNGGILASLVDCHSVGTAMADAYRRSGREIGSEPQIWYVTANLNISYLRPTPIDTELELVATVIAVEGRKTRLTCTVSAAGLTCVTADVLAVEVKRDL